MSDDEDGGETAPSTTQLENISAALSAALEHINQRAAERNRPQSSASSTAGGREIQEMIDDIWEVEQLKGDALWESYRESVRRQLIDSMSTKEQRMLRNYLRDNGAPIRHGTGIPIYRALTEALPVDIEFETPSVNPLPPLVGPSQLNTSGPIYTQAPPTTDTRTYS